VLRPVKAGWRAGLGFAALLLAVATAEPAAAADFTPDQLAAIYRHSPLPPLPPDGSDELAGNQMRAAALGQYLFFDRGLSANGRLACASCHQPARAFTDGRAVAQGLARGTRHTPSLIDVAYGSWFFWGGRADSLWSQALQPLENPKETGGDRLAIAHHVFDHPALRQAFEHLFGPLPPLADRRRFPPHARPDPDPRSPAAQAWQAMAAEDRAAVNRVYADLGKAIEAYERRLVDGNSPFDAYVVGLRTGDRAKLRALSPAARRGLGLFVGAANCELCHSGPAFSDGQFHNLGLPLLPGETVDAGRAAGIALVKADIFNAAGLFSDAPPDAEARQRLDFLPAAKSQLGAFKTPGLRDVALTAPYMHDGRFATLSQVLRFYAQGRAASRGQFVGEREATLDLVPRLGASQIADLVAFLQSLTGQPLPGALTEAPARP
jgi:cytochrome c peroxidase